MSLDVSLNRKADEQSVCSECGQHYFPNNSPNGWGTYKYFVPWLEKYLAACKEYPDAVVEVSR